MVVLSMNVCVVRMEVISWNMLVGQCDKEGGDNDNTFSTSSPYFRVGMDYNINKKLNGNRFFCGLRYAFSSFQYDVCNPDFNDPVWKVSSPLILNGQDGKM